MMFFFNYVIVASSANILKARESLSWCATVIGHVYDLIKSGLILLYLISQSKQALQLEPARAARAIARTQPELSIRGAGQEDRSSGYENACFFLFLFLNKLKLPK